VSDAAEPAWAAGRRGRSVQVHCARRGVLCTPRCALRAQSLPVRAPPRPIARSRTERTGVDIRTFVAGIGRGDRSRRRLPRGIGLARRTFLPPIPIAGWIGLARSTRRRDMRQGPPTLSFPYPKEGGGRRSAGAGVAAYTA